MEVVAVLALAFSLLALFLWFGSVWIPWLNGPPYCYPDSPAEQPSGTESSTRSSEHSGSQPSAINPVHERWHPQEKEHKRHERLYWRLSLILGLAGLIGAIAATAIASFAYFATSGQLAAMHAQERPYIVVDKFDFVPEKSPEGRILWWIAVPIFENVGQTSAAVSYINSPCFDAHCHGFDIGGPEDPEVVYQRLLKMNHWPFLPQHAVIGPNRAKKIKGGAGIRTFDQNGKVVHDYWWGVIHYRDAFQAKDSPDHITKFCYSFYGPMEDQPKIAQCNRWNCADEECKDDREDYEKDIAPPSDQ
jgi:hypothetical protein